MNKRCYYFPVSWKACYTEGLDRALPLDICLHSTIISFPVTALCITISCVMHLINKHFSLMENTGVSGMWHSHKIRGWVILCVLSKCQTGRPLMPPSSQKIMNEKRNFCTLWTAFLKKKNIVDKLVKKKTTLKYGALALYIIQTGLHTHKRNYPLCK